MADARASKFAGSPASASESVASGSTRAQEDELRWVAIPIDLPLVGESATFQIDDVELLLCNAEGTPFVIRDECPHVRTSLQGGAIRGTVIECPMHGGQMDLRDGSPVAMPIRRPGTCFPVRAVDDGLHVGLKR